MDENQPISIVIADDHPMLLDTLKVSLKASNYNVIRALNNGKTALDAILHLAPDVALLDVDMPKLSGFDIVKHAKVKRSQTKFIILTYHKKAEYIAQAKRLQIDGYLLKEEPFSIIDAAIKEVMNGKNYFSKSFKTALLENSNADIGILDSLTPSELKILNLISRNMDSQAIAGGLNVSKRTVDKHRSNIISKLKLSGDANSLTNWAIEHRKVVQGL